MMAEDTPVKESPCYKTYHSSITTSTPLKNLNDSGYNTQSSILSNASSNLNQISEVSPRVSLSLNHTPSDLGIYTFSSNSQNFTLDHNESKLGDITNKTYSDVNFSLTPYQELSPTKKFKSSLEVRMRYHLNKCPEDNENHFIKRKNSEKNFSRQEHVIPQLHISMEGRENIDIMHCLARVPHVVEKIFSFLSDSDVISASMVSRTWCSLVKNSPVAQKKKSIYFKLSKENRGVHEGRDRSSFNNKGCLANISNVMRSPSKRDLPQRSPPVSPSKFRIHLFHKEAKKLSSNEQLVRCPRCSRPASWSPSQSTRAECKGLHCKFIFCTDCRCEYSNNGEHTCLLSIPISYNRRLMTSNLNKRKHNLRRL